MTASIATGPFATGRRSVDASPADGCAHARTARLERLLGAHRPGAGSALAFAARRARRLRAAATRTRYGLLRPLRVAGRGLAARAARRSPTRSTTASVPTTTSRTCCLATGADAALGLPSAGPRAAPVPAAAGGRAAAVRGASGAWPRTRALVAAVLGAINVGLCWRMLHAGHRRAATRPSWAPSSTASARSPGTRRCWARPGSWRTSWPARSCSWPSPPRSTRSAGRPSRAPDGARRSAGSPLPRQSVAGLLFGIGRLARLTDDLRGAVLRVRGRRRHLAPAGGRGGHRRASSRCCCCSATTWPPRATSSTPPTTTSARSSTGRCPSCYHADWGIEDPRYILAERADHAALAARSGRCRATTRPATPDRPALARPA